MNTFDSVSGHYKEKALIQQTAASNLLSLIEIRKSDNILDVACGPGHITNKISKITHGIVTGIDISEGMIKQAKNFYRDMDFRHIAAEEMDYENEFDIAFCNSSLMWFENPGKAIKGIFNALKTGVNSLLPALRLPTGHHGSRSSCQKSPLLAISNPFFTHWKSPWFFLPAKDDYRVFFEKQGFKTEHIEVRKEITDYSVEEAYNVYLSGAGNGFTGKKYYDIEIDDDYVSAFNDHVNQEIRKESTNGRLKVEFNRLYYIGIK